MKFGIQKNPKNNKSQNQNPFCPKCRQYFFMPEKGVPAPFGALPAHFLRGWANSANRFESADPAIRYDVYLDMIMRGRDALRTTRRRPIGLSSGEIESESEWTGWAQVGGPTWGPSGWAHVGAKWAQAKNLGPEKIQTITILKIEIRSAQNVGNIF